MGILHMSQCVRLNTISSNTAWHWQWYCPRVHRSPFHHWMRTVDQPNSNVMSINIPERMTSDFVTKTNSTARNSSWKIVTEKYMANFLVLDRYTVQYLVLVTWTIMGLRWPFHRSVIDISKPHQRFIFPPIYLQYQQQSEKRWISAPLEFCLDMSSGNTCS